MKQILFVTSNELKFRHANEILSAFNIVLTQQHMDLQEMQSDDGEAITRHKAEQAFAAYKQPLVVNDDSWSIPGLNGFPGAYMKSMNQWFTSDDWLRLTKDLADRRAILQQHVVYQDEHGQQHFLREITGTLLKEARGNSKHTHRTITSFDGGKMSGPQRDAAGLPAIDPSTPTAWHDFGEWFTSYSAL